MVISLKNSGRMLRTTFLTLSGYPGVVDVLVPYYLTTTVVTIVRGHVKFNKIKIIIIYVSENFPVN